MKEINFLIDISSKDNSNVSNLSDFEKKSSSVTKIDDGNVFYFKTPNFKTPLSI